MKRLIFLVTMIALLPLAAYAEDLYVVSLEDRASAATLTQLELTAIYRIGNDYLVLADKSRADLLESSKLVYELLAEGISLDELAVDGRTDRSNIGKHNLIFEYEEFRLFRIEPALKASAKDILPLAQRSIPIVYRANVNFAASPVLADLDLDSLISLVSQDTVSAYLHRLQAFDGRLAGTQSNLDASAWIRDKFISFGYDSVALDSFQANGNWYRNAMAYRTGTRFPDQQIVIGGHMDAVSQSPGADDNGSGTTGVLECARVLADIETEMTLVFVAFDYEEGGLHGAWHHASEAFARNDDIVFMLNMDMIGHIVNDSQARLFYGDEIGYSALWAYLADSLVGIEGQFAGYSGGSDHVPYIQYGYQATFVHEMIFSSVYHSYQDNTSYINFDYMTRMIKASLATVYTVASSLPPMHISSIVDVGDGQSLLLLWDPPPTSAFDHFKLFYGQADPFTPDSIIISGDSTQFLIDGLTDGVTYAFFLTIEDIDGNRSPAFTPMYGTPRSLPLPPGGLQAETNRNSIWLSWSGDGQPLDLDHYALIRDRAIVIDPITGTAHVDMDPSLGSDFHSYLVVSVDTDGNRADTTGIEPVVMKAATLDPNRILAINRSGSSLAAMVDEDVTGEFIHEALDGYNYDYIADNSQSLTNLFNFIDYSMIVIGGESARRDDLGDGFGQVLSDIDKYMSIGGNAVIFGRWSSISSTPDVDTLPYEWGPLGNPYASQFRVTARVFPYSTLDLGNKTIYSDLIGAHSVATGYPYLEWDSMATVNHDGRYYTQASGVPCVAYPLFLAPQPEEVYTWDSQVDSSLTEGRVVAWRNIVPEGGYVFFDIPLSFFERTQAVAAMRQALDDLSAPTGIADGPSELPTAFTLNQNYPNPFNPKTTIRFSLATKARARVDIYNVLGQKVATVLDEVLGAGDHTVDWDGSASNGRKVASGLYFYRLTTESQTSSRKMILLK